MSEESATEVTVAPSVLVERNPGAQLAIALTAFALLLCLNSIFNAAWLTTSVETDLADIESNVGLYQTEIKTCMGGICETETNDFTQSQEDFEVAGITAIVLLSLTMLMMLSSTFFHMKKLISSKGRLGEIISLSGGALVLISLLIWYLLLPESEGITPDLGQGFWMSAFSGIFLLGAGVTNHFQNFIDGPPRMRARGVRYGNDTSELVLKESSCGDTTLSILVDEELVRVVSINRVGASSNATDLLASKRNAYMGFAHQRFDFLDDLKGIFWVLTGASLISCIMISWMFLILLIPSSLLAILQLMDPERFTISTSSGDHSFIINRWRSNRELTNIAMDVVDEQMLSVLRGNELDTSVIDERAEMIAIRFVQSRESNKAETITEVPIQAQPNVQALADLPPPSPPPEFAGRVTQPLTNNLQVPVENQTPSEETSVEELQSQADGPIASDSEPESEPEPVPVESQPLPNPPTPTVAASDLPPPPVMPGPPVPSPSAPTPPPPVMPGPPVPPPSAPMPLPPVMPGPPVPPPSAPMPLPPVMPGPPVPPPGAPMPPPPGAMGMQVPPPPVMAAPITPPPPVVVQAAPREENLSSDEKENILGDLRD